MEKHDQLIAKIKAKYEKINELINEYDRAVQMENHQFHLIRDPVGYPKNYFLIRLSDKKIIAAGEWYKVKSFVNGWRNIPHNEILNESNQSL